MLHYANEINHVVKHALGQLDRRIGSSQRDGGCKRHPRRKKNTDRHSDGSFPFVFFFIRLKIDPTRAEVIPAERIMDPQSCPEYPPDGTEQQVTDRQTDEYIDRLMVMKNT